MNTNQNKITEDTKTSYYSPFKRVYKIIINHIDKIDNKQDLEKFRDKLELAILQINKTLKYYE
ncbi:hypothetical protein [Mycoplasma capricolum]|uniref:Uncharacterized protein n=1 Tax=Mycoplasma capricolum subsp. capricolum TaxID=40479 RepID=A0A0C3A2N3_MYCCA|nr:hypothetical protein [Mycoplasma capricolum]KIM13771.1 hypothetical protein MCGM508_01605 [Mycoplasma capricolum subsp. capricolum]WBX36253.1 hypothetical protein NO343_04865 [Mycoplasma capricolum subsp. capricolum]